MKKRSVALLLSLCFLFSLVGCGNPSTDRSSESSSAMSSAHSSESSEAERSSPESSEAESPSASSLVSEDDAEGSPLEEAGPVRVAALKGPTAMGMIQLADNDAYEFSLYPSADEVTPKIIQGEVDIAAVPANLAAILYQKTQGGVTALDINTLGVLYILENGNSVQSVADLRGKTIFASGKGSVPEYALNYMLSENGIDPQTDVTIEFKSEHTECVAALTTTENAVAMLPQPFATVAQKQNDGIEIVLDMTKEWEALADGNDVTLVTGVTLVRTQFLSENPEAVRQFLADHAASVDFVNGDPVQAAPLMEAQDIVPAPVAETAIPLCNIRCITGPALKAQLSTYLAVLADQNPEAVGGSLPGDDFYCDLDA